MASAIDPTFITAAPVSKTLMKQQLQVAKDEITQLQDVLVPLKLNKAGDTMTGNLIIASPAKIGVETASPDYPLTVAKTSISGGTPLATGSAADPNVVARLQAGSVAFDFGVLAAGQAWIQARAAADYSLKYQLQLNPNGGGVRIFGQLQSDLGTAAAPAYSFSGDTDTGIYNSGPNVIAAAVNGGRVLTISDGAATIDANAVGDVSLFLRNNTASGAITRGAVLGVLNESSVPVSAINSLIQSDGGSQIYIEVTPPGPRGTDRRVNRVTIPGSGPVTVDGKALQIQRATEVTPTGVSFVDFTGIPAGVRRITIMFDNLSFVANDTISIQLGDAGGIETTGYVGNVGVVAGTSSGTISASSASQFSCFNSTWLAAEVSFGVIELFNMSGNKWIIKSRLSRSGTLQIHEAIGAKTLSDVLDRVRVKSDGSNFDNGSINLWTES